VGIEVEAGRLADNYWSTALVNLDIEHANSVIYSVNKDMIEVHTTHDHQKAQRLQCCESI
jgi:hypothetical protein